MNKVLIVDDNKVIRLMLAEMLKKIDGVEIAGACETAISMLLIFYCWMLKCLA
jgi:CheY-like chemotaxis protein